MARPFDEPAPRAASDADTDKNSCTWYEHEETASQTCESSVGDDKPEVLPPLSRGKAIALVITLTGAAFINVSERSDCFRLDHLIKSET